MCCTGVKKTVKTVTKIATGYAYLAMGINEELSKERLKICRNCINFESPACKICGCDMAAKTRLPNEECPDKRNRRWLRAA
jgi:hypothetical protein